MTEENPSYHGIRFYETFGDFAFCVAARALSLRDLGPCLAPMNAFLVLTGMETLPLRMRRHCDNALTVARWLEAMPRRMGELCGLEKHKLHAAQQKYCPRAPARCSPSAQGRLRCRVKLVNNVRIFPISPISATRGA